MNKRNRRASGAASANRGAGASHSASQDGGPPSSGDEGASGGTVSSGAAGLTAILHNSSDGQQTSLRRSTRKTGSLIEQDRKKEAERKILQKSEEGLQVGSAGDKGDGLFTTRPFGRGEFVVLCDGELIRRDDEHYGQIMVDTRNGSYEYVFEHNNIDYSVISSSRCENIGRYVNHSAHDYNTKMKVFPIADVPYVVLTATRDIQKGEEVLVDYGETNIFCKALSSWL